VKIVDKQEENMGAQINDLVALRDYQTLYELMTEEDDILLQLEAAEGLLKLGDKRALDWLLLLKESDDEDISGAAKEMLELPETKRMLEYLNAESKAERKAALAGALANAKVRLQKGRKVFLHKIVYVPGDVLFMQEEFITDSYNILALDTIGLTGWEVVNIIPLQTPAAKSTNTLGAYFLVKKEVAADESAELEEI
jgi:hypothetical protein